MDNQCLVCNLIIPEGLQVCPACQADITEDIEKRKSEDLKMGSMTRSIQRAAGRSAIITVNNQICPVCGGILKTRFNGKFRCDHCKKDFVAKKKAEGKKK